MLRILLVDDEQGALDALSNLLTGEGHEVRTATGGHAAIEMVGNQRPDIVLLDIAMPDLNGLETLERLLALDPELAVIMVTAVRDEHLARKAMALGAFDYVTKPIDVDHLLTCITVKSILIAC